MADLDAILTRRLGNKRSSKVAQRQLVLPALDLAGALRRRGVGGKFSSGGPKRKTLEDLPNRTIKGLNPRKVAAALGRRRGAVIETMETFREGASKRDPEGTLGLWMEHLEACKRYLAVRPDTLQRWSGTWKGERFNDLDVIDASGGWPRGSVWQACVIEKWRARGTYPFELGLEPDQALVLVWKIVELLPHKVTRYSNYPFGWSHVVLHPSHTEVQTKELLGRLFGDGGGSTLLPHGGHWVKGGNNPRMVISKSLGASKGLELKGCRFITLVRRVVEEEYEIFGGFERELRELVWRSTHPIIGTDVGKGWPVHEHDWTGDEQALYYPHLYPQGAFSESCSICMARRSVSKQTGAVISGVGAPKKT